ncbi:MAG: hypothetical protein ABJA66_19440, partial [Actinomycetota bacterium]
KCEGKEVKTVSVEIEDDKFYRLTCDKGHEATYFFSNSKFEILFEIAVLALIDGYTREAVATLAAGVEEFYRFFINLFLVKNSIYRQDETGAFEKELFNEAQSFWRLTNLAERQIGAFAIAYLLEKRKAPEFPDRKYTEFRNNVIHKGYIPKYDDVVIHGDRILNFILPLLREYREGFDFLITKGVEVISNMKTEHRNTPNKVSTSYPSFIWRMILDENKNSFQDAIEIVKNGTFLGKK